MNSKVVSPPGSLPQGSAVPAQECVLFSIHQPMISARGDLQGRKYHLVQRGGGRRWVVADQEAAADNVYADGGPNSQGMGGATCRFELVTGGFVEFKGPWKASADGLFKETGHDVRDRYTTRGIVALERQHGESWNSPDSYSGVLHCDPEPVVGNYYRVKDIAEAWARELGHDVVFASVSQGGGTADRTRLFSAMATTP